MTKMMCRKHKVEAKGLKCPEDKRCQEFSSVNDSEPLTEDEYLDPKGKKPKKEKKPK